MAGTAIDFILVHGGMHDGGCWALLERELAALGHRTFAPDYPLDCAGVWFDDYADAVVAAVAGKARDDAWLVGHSMGGQVIPRVAAKRPVGGLIYLCALYPARNEAEFQENFVPSEALGAHLSVSEDGMVTMSRKGAIAGFYSDVPPALADEAIARLRPQWSGVINTFQPLDRHPDVPVKAILTTEDGAVPPDFNRRTARQRLGIEPAEMPGSHSPFLSRPRELAQLLDSLARQG
jgi:pimeloyl-ACP methyl ester carboxylesterase